MEKTIIIYYEKNKHKEYMKLFDKLNYDKFKSNGSIVMMTGEKYFWHDYKIELKNIQEFITHFENVACKYVIIK